MIKSHTRIYELLTNLLVMNQVNIIVLISLWRQVCTYWIISWLGNHKSVFLQWLDAGKKRRKCRSWLWLSCLQHELQVIKNIHIMISNDCFNENSALSHFSVITVSCVCLTKEFSAEGDVLPDCVVFVCS